MDQDVKISCRNLWKIFGQDPAGFLERHANAPTDEALKAEGYVGAVRDVSFDVATGEILIVMGLSGSGKSTLIRCLSRLNDPTSGEIEFEGRDILRLNAAELIEVRRHRMGMVFQHFGLLPHRNVLSNVAFPLEVRGMSRQERETRAREMIRLVGLEGREGYYPRELSGGQQQRVGIARSLAVAPEVWFLDEPFSALDPLIRREMQDEFLRLQKMLHKTIVFITHDFDEAVRLADRIGIMKDGYLVQMGTAEEMVSKPANDYVAAFTKNAPRDRIIRVKTVMRPLPSDGVNEATDGVEDSATLGDVAGRVFATEVPVVVFNEDKKPVGTICRDDIAAALYGTEAS
jgi:glycine betaine/proline transport system ATP-binding protein